MKISLLQCHLLILMLQITSNMADGASQNGTIHQLPTHPSQELQEANENAESNSGKILSGKEHAEAEKMLSNLRKIGGHGMGGRVVGGTAVAGAAAQIARRKHHHHGSNGPPPISILKPLTATAILISLLIL